MFVKKIISDFSIYGLAPYIPKFASFLILPIISPYLTPADFGIFGLVLSYTYFFEVLYTLGLTVHLGNSFYVYPNKFKIIWRQIHGFWIIWGFVYALLLSTVLYLVIPEEAGKNKYLIIFLLVTPTVFFGPLFELGKYFYQFSKKPLEIGIRSAVFGVISVLLTLYLIRFQGLGYMGWFWSLFIVNIITAISWIYPIYIKEKLSPIFNFKIKTIKRLLKVSLPIVPHTNSLYILNQSDRVVMDFLKTSTAQIGLYNASYTIASIFDSIGNSYTQTIIPYVYEMLKNKEEEKLRLFFFLNQGIFFLISFTLCLFSKELSMFLIRNDEFSDIYPLLTLILISMSFRPMYVASSLRFFYFEKTKNLSYISFAAGLANIVLNLILIPYFGIMAAALSTILGFLFISYGRFFTKEFKNICSVSYHPMKWLLLSLLFSIVTFSLIFLDLKIRVFIIMGVLILCFMILLLKKDEIIRLWRK